MSADRADPTAPRPRRPAARGGKGGAEPRSVIRHRAEQVVALTEQGLTQAAIATELGISQAAVSKILKRVDEQALRSLATQVAYLKMRGVRHLAYLSREGRRGWEDSKRGRIRRRQTKGVRADGTPTVTQDVVVDEHPDPRMLDQARKAEEALADLLGLTAVAAAEARRPTDPGHPSDLPPLLQLSDDLLERAHGELTRPRQPAHDSE